MTTHIEAWTRGDALWGWHCLACGADHAALFFTPDGAISAGDSHTCAAVTS